MNKEANTVAHGRIFFGRMSMILGRMQRLTSAVERQPAKRRQICCGLVPPEGYCSRMRLPVIERRRRPAHRVVQRENQLGRAAAFFSCAFVSSAALLTACLDQRPLFSEIGVAPDSANSGGMSTVGAPDPGETEEPGAKSIASPEVPPFGGELTGMAGATIDGSDNPLLPNADPPVDAGTPLGAGDAAAYRACNNCLSNECPDAIESCNTTPGCEAISVCARSTGCLGDACYCGAVNPLLCATTGQGDGPCRDVILAAPEAHEPTPVDPTSGPASEAARLVGNCRLASVGCRDVCGGPGD